MIIFMSDIICITNRLLCTGEFLKHLEEIARCQPAGIILREKDLSESEYKALAIKVIEICEKYNVSCILHNFVSVAIELNAKNIHIPLPALQKMTDKEKSFFEVLGASCHSVEEAVEAEKLGCTYIIAGHIFPTDCKKKVPPRGLTFLKEACESVSIPVLAIGGIDEKNIESIRETGAKGSCIMSGLMCCKDVEDYMKCLKVRGGKFEWKN